MDWQVDLVRTVLDSPEWVGYVQDFIEVHHRKWAPRSRRQRAEGKFSEGKRSNRETKIGGYTHQQYLVFKEFSQYVEALVTSKLSELGVTEHDFQKTCKDFLLHAGETPRDQMFKETLQQLLSYNSFTNFCDMMQHAYDDYDSETAFARPSNERMYVAPSNERGRVTQASHDYEYQLQLALAESKREMEANKQRRQKTVNHHPNSRNAGSRNIGDSPAYGVPAEWNVQVTTAESIINASKEGKLTPEENAVFKPWALQVVDIDAEYKLLAQGAGMMSVVHEKIQELNMLRLKVDLLVAQQMTKENEQRRKDLNNKVEKWHEEMVTNPKGDQQAIIDQAEATLDDLLSRVANVHEEVSSKFLEEYLWKK